jgi:uncharacterized protein DUF3168
MIELGLVQLVQGNPAVAALATAGGGFFAQLPKDQTLPSWSYAVVSDSDDYVLTGPMELGSRRFQLDCYGANAADAISLAKAIDAVLNGYRGQLTDPDATFVQGCFHLNTVDFFDTNSRTFRRMLEYFVWSP